MKICFVYILLSQRSAKFAHCRYFTHMATKAKSINLSCIKSLELDYLRLFLFSSNTQGSHFKKSLHARGLVRELLLLSRFFLCCHVSLVARAVPVKFDLYLNLTWNAEICSFRHPSFTAPWLCILSNQDLWKLMYTVNTHFWKFEFFRYIDKLYVTSRWFFHRHSVKTLYKCHTCSV